MRARSEGKAPLRELVAAVSARWPCSLSRRTGGCTTFGMEGDDLESGGPGLASVVITSIE
ncbi:hypothetical protein BE08_33815 [Sorangium cellulosum]|uniref:Uncharacterized protein n=1 Tax=Sorangium cellulosum TaxID=56 RepID=A0A150P9S5_SORCE|nr:hypothetical protein BE08_33815 [Sorangium cellulosum]